MADREGGGVKPTCTITERVTGPCCLCRIQASPAHIVTEECYRDAAEDWIYCAGCCPACYKAKRTPAG